ncbi:hypothetical protein [Streptomyces sp. ODS05-4]|nr:hypothetical protein [Streptomyces sp. ODS05-4]
MSTSSESAVIWVPYSPELTRWSFIGTAIVLVVIWIVFRGRR